MTSCGQTVSLMKTMHRRIIKKASMRLCYFYFVSEIYPRKQKLTYSWTIGPALESPSSRSARETKRNIDCKWIDRIVTVFAKGLSYFTHHRGRVCFLHFGKIKLRRVIAPSYISECRRARESVTNTRQIGRSLRDKSCCRVQRTFQRGAAELLPWIQND